MSENTMIRNCTFAYKCETKWENLEQIDYEDVRFCNACQKEVHFCQTDEDLVKNIYLNRCVAFYRNNEIIETGYISFEKNP